jgi:hypothetical protein
MRDAYGDVIFTRTPVEAAPKVDRVRVVLENLDPVMAAQRDWFRKVQPAPDVDFNKSPKLKSFAQIGQLKRFK